RALRNARVGFDGVEVVDADAVAEQRDDAVRRHVALDADLIAAAHEDVFEDDRRRAGRTCIRIFRPAQSGSDVANGDALRDVRITGRRRNRRAAAGRQLNRVRAEVAAGAGRRAADAETVRLREFRVEAFVDVEHERVVLRNDLQLARRRFRTIGEQHSFDAAIDADGDAGAPRDGAAGVRSDGRKLGADAGIVAEFRDEVFGAERTDDAELARPRSRPDADVGVDVTGS